jgi:hypothetical protein
MRSRGARDATSRGARDAKSRWRARCEVTLRFEARPKVETAYRARDAVSAGATRFAQSAAARVSTRTTSQLPSLVRRES